MLVVYSRGDNPHLALRFLRNLNYVLDRGGVEGGSDKTQTRQRGEGGRSAGKVHTSRKAGHTDTSMIDPALLHKPRGGSRGGPQLLAVLGITHAWLCKESLSQLQVTHAVLLPYPTMPYDMSPPVVLCGGAQRSLEVTIASLTDLDLTHALIGYTGALVGEDMSNLYRRRSQL